MAKEIYCNICGQKMGSFDADNYVSISEMLGYGSKYDGEFVDIDICPGCLDKLIDQMTISPFKD